MLIWVCITVYSDLPQLVISVVGDPFFDPLSFSTTDTDCNENGFFYSSHTQDRNADSGDPLISSYGDYNTTGVYLCTYVYIQILYT